uniref:Schlafen AlbA-2 domain-containing protein n=1 Tax=Dromaius novaehollandiae TaxID=8790 RepID=A0A8C4KFC1_DRONO
ANLTQHGIGKEPDHYIEKIVLGEISRKKISDTVCALLNSGGGVVRMEIENKNYYFQEHSIGLDVEQSLRQQSYFVLFVKNLKLKKENHIKTCGENGLSPKKALLNVDGGAKGIPLNTRECHIQATAAKLLREKLMAGEVLDFTETSHVEFKNFSARDVLKYIREIFLNYVSAFANTQGGYLIFGVDDSSKVFGSDSEVGKEALAKTIADVMGSLPIYHFHRSQTKVQFKSNILNVYDKEEHLQGYGCAPRVGPSCWAVFHDTPHSWIVKGSTADRLSIKKWT